MDRIQLGYPDELRGRTGETVGGTRLLTVGHGTADQDALAALMQQATETRTAILCSETVWWRCHRRLIADHTVLLDGVSVNHLMPGAKFTAHNPTDGVRTAGNELVYDVVP